MRAVFLDRDGVINRYPGDFQYVKSWKEFRFLPRVKSPLRKLTRAGFKIFVISNQAGVSKGIYSKKELRLITRNMLKNLGSGISISRVYYCIHRKEENCDCRKPMTGLVDNALSGLKKRGIKVDLSESFFVGDTIRDVETGKRAGLKTILVFSGKEKPANAKKWEHLPDFTAAGLKEAADIILKN
ncbi:MAG: HAD family hydrolase [Candidatus Omnitrophica bacterium]|nr:HAD family hydrolase [Candidatus Omnitrophota bacterium]